MERWRDELLHVGGVSPLIRFEDSVRTRIELSTTHPSGLAQFITGKTTLLSNLIRTTSPSAPPAPPPSTLTAKAVELAATRGFDTMHLAIGLAEWRFEKQDFRGPVLLRPLAIRRYGRDFELRLKGALQLNPGLVAAMRRSSTSSSTRPRSSRSPSPPVRQAAARHRSASRADEPPPALQRAAATADLLLR